MDLPVIIGGSLVAAAAAAFAASSLCCPRSGGGGGGDGASSQSAAAESSANSSLLPTGVMLSSLPRGSMVEAKLGPDGSRGTVLLAHTAGGTLSATSAKCTHYGAPLVKGVLSGERIVCQWHAACFSAGSGDIEDGPVVKPLARYALSVLPSGELAVALPDGATVPTVAGAGGQRAALACAAQADGSGGGAAAAPPGMVIIGGGAAALAAVEGLRQHGWRGAITVLCGERALPYDRTKVSKSLDVPPPLRDAAWFAALGVDLRLGVRALDVAPAARTVRLSDGGALRYEALLCASGGVPRRFLPPERFTTPGAELGCILPMRDAGDAAALDAALAAVAARGGGGGGGGGSGGARVVIVGSSFIGMEVAALLVERQGVASVTVVGMEAVPFERVLGREVGTLMRALHEARGVRFAMGATVQRFEAAAAPAAAVGRVLLAPSGEALPADIVVIGAGIIPALDYLRGEACAAAGIELPAAAPGGVRVDAALRTGAPGVFAAGDVALFPYTLPGVAAPLQTRIEHWAVAHDQGRVAARSMLGLPAAYDRIPFFWTAAYGRVLRYAGHAHSYERLIVHGALSPAPPPAGCTFVAYYVAGGRAVAVATMGRDPQAAAASELLRLDAMPTPAELDAAAAEGGAGTDLVAHLQRVQLAAADAKDGEAPPASPSARAATPRRRAARA